MFNTIKMLAVAGAIVAGATLVQTARADNIGLGVGMGMNVRPVSTTFINPSPVVYAVPAYTGPVYAAPAYIAPSYMSTEPPPGAAYVLPAYTPIFTGGASFGVEQGFYQPNFYYGGGYYQTGGVSSSPFFNGYARPYYGSGFYGAGAYGGVAYPTAGYRTAPVWAGPRYNGMPSRLTFGPLSRW